MHKVKSKLLSFCPFAFAVQQVIYIYICRNIKTSCLSFYSCFAWCGTLAMKKQFGRYVLSFNAAYSRRTANAAVGFSIGILSVCFCWIQTALTGGSGLLNLNKHWLPNETPLNKVNFELSCSLAHVRYECDFENCLDKPQFWINYIRTKRDHLYCVFTSADDPSSLDNVPVDQCFLLTSVPID